MSPPLGRTLLIAVLVAVVVGTGLVDRVVGRGPSPAAPVGALSPVGVAPTMGTESSAWYCAGGTGAQGSAPGTIVLTNGSARPVPGTVTVVPAQAQGASPPAPWSGASVIPVDVPADGATTVAASQLGSSAVVGEAVVLDGGGVAVAQAVAGPLGWSTAPCSTSTSAQWYVAHGATSQGGGLTLNLFNPGATNATVDVTLVSATAGSLAPAAYQGIDVGPGSLVTENLGDHDTNDPDVATEVSALTGTVVATELQAVGVAGDGGLSLVPGTAVPARRWVFPQSTDGPGTTVSFHVLNPSSGPARVSVELLLPRGTGAVPLTMTVPPETAATLVANEQTRIPAGVAYGAVFSSGGPGIVVSRQISAPAGPASPAPEDGEVVGVAGGWRNWIVPAAPTPGTGISSLAVVDLGTRPAHVRLVTSDGAPITGQAPRLVEPGAPLLVQPGPGLAIGFAPFAVASDQPVALEADAVPVAAPGAVVLPAFARG